MQINACVYKYYFCCFDFLLLYFIQWQKQCVVVVKDRDLNPAHDISQGFDPA